jgi:hypothetical protein
VAPVGVVNPPALVNDIIYSCEAAEEEELENFPIYQ